MKTTQESQTESQNKRIAKHLKSGKSISPLRALELFGCFRLASRIFDIQRPPYNLNITSELIHEGSYKFARYSIVKPKRA